MQIREAFRAGIKSLEEHGTPSASLAAELLLMHVLGYDRAQLYTRPEQELSHEQGRRYFHLIAERASGKPTQYLTGHQEFWGLDLQVSPAVLIPRPETEHLIEAVLSLIARSSRSKRETFRIVDVGTGSGCIAIALASELPNAKIYATDISRAAMDVAWHNSERLGMSGRIEFVEGDLLEPFVMIRSNGSFDLVVSNPPYVGHEEIESVQREVRDYEPRIAWGDLESGEEIYARLFPQALAALKPGGFVAVEIGYNQSEAVIALLGSGWTEREIRPDLAGIPRVVIARKE